MEWIDLVWGTHLTECTWNALSKFDYEPPLYVPFCNERYAIVTIAYKYIIQIV